MTREQIKDELSKYSNFVELFGRANQLKQSGENPTVVNKIVMELRKKLMATQSSMLHMSKTPVPTLIEEPVNGYLSYMVENLNKPVIVFDGENILI